MIFILATIWYFYFREPRNLSDMVWQWRIHQVTFSIMSFNKDSKQISKQPLEGVVIYVYSAIIRASTRKQWYPFKNLDILFNTFVTQSDILRIYQDTCIAWVTCTRHNTKKKNAQCKGFTLTNIIIYVSILKYEHKKRKVLGVWNIQASTININSTYTVYEQKFSENSKIKAHLHEMRRNFTQLSVHLI